MSNIHFIGIGGIGMSALAHILCEKGVSVSGSDMAASATTEALKKKGAQIFIGHAPENVLPGSTVVFSTDIKEDNVELMRAKELHLPLLHRSEMLGKLMGDFSALLVTGTHGKTTTSSLLAHVLKVAGVNPTFAIGGQVKSLGSNGGYGAGKYFVAEADESDGSFLKYPGFGAIVTNIDNDHIEYWKTEEALIKGFKQFMSHITSKEHLFWCIDDPLLANLAPQGVSYGFHPKAQLRIERFSQEGWHLNYDLHFDGVTIKNIRVPLIGKHNVYNSAAVFGLCLRVGVEEEKIKEAFLSFQGVGRRADKKGEWKGIPLYDDYAHHPTEIAATLQAVKQAAGERRLVVVFQPHRYTRVRDCFEQFADVFVDADLLVMTDIYAAREKPIDGITTETLKAKIKKQSLYAPRRELAPYLSALLAPSDLVLTIGAGDVTTLASELINSG